MIQSSKFKIKNLHIIADDLGLHKSVNDGIICLLKEGRIDGASIMANGKAFDDAITQCLEVEPPNIGVHVVLVEEKSLTGIKLPKNHKTFFIKYILGQIKLLDIEREIKAQLDKIINSGIRPNFINSHQHLHLLPDITNIVIEMAKKYNVDYIRTVGEPIKFGNGKLFRKIQFAYLNFLSNMSRNKIIKSGLKTNNYFISFINAGNLNIKDLEIAHMLAEKYPNEIIEVGCHPGYEDEELKSKYSHWGNYNRVGELELLNKLSK